MAMPNRFREIVICPFEFISYLMGTNVCVQARGSKYLRPIAGRAAVLIGLLGHDTGRKERKIPRNTISKRAKYRDSDSRFRFAAPIAPASLPFAVPVPWTSITSRVHIRSSTSACTQAHTTANDEQRCIPNTSNLCFPLHCPSKLSFLFFKCVFLEI